MAGVAVGLVLVGLLGCGGGKGTPSAQVATGPAAPTGLTAIGADAQVSLFWNASSGATAYRIKRGSPGGPYAQIASTPQTRWVDPGRTNGTTYAYVVSAAHELEGPDSPEVQATPTTGLSVLPPEDPTRNRLGMNVWFLSDWDNSFAFVDAMKHARPWRDGADWNKPVAGLDAQGWPTADASTVILSGTPAQLNGTYKLVFNGQAEVSCLFFGSAATVSNKAYDAATNTSTAEVTFSYTSSAPMGLVFRNTKRTATSSANTGFSNARLYRPGYPGDGSVVFAAPFLTALGKTSVVRMMDWTATNANLTRTWSQRRKPQDAAQPGPSYTGPGGKVWANSDLGVALEHQIQLANALHSDCWINIPVVADEDHVRNIALALRYGTDGRNPYTSPQANPVFPPLDPTLRIYVEYANEIWNSAAGFDCFGVIQDLVGSLPVGHPLLTPAENSIWFKMWRWPAFRLAQISDTFRAVYGDASMMSRVRPVLMTQQGNGQMTLEQALNWLDSYGKAQSPARAVNSYLFGAGGSAYYGVNAEPADKTDVDGFFAPGNYPATQNVKGMGVDAVWAANFGLRRIAYEGGPSLDNYKPDAAARAINADARMQDMVVKTHEAWSAVGGDLLMYYTLSGASMWEFTPDIARTDSPKFKAIDQLNVQSRPAVTLGQALPGTLVAADHLANRIRTGYDYVTTLDGLSCIGGNRLGSWIAFPGHVGTGFTGRLVVNGVAAQGATLKVWINGERRGEVVLAAGSHLTDSTALTGLAIPAGLVVIRLEVVSGEFTLRAITVG